MWLSSSESVLVYKLWQAAMDLDWIRETWLNKNKKRQTKKRERERTMFIGTSATMYMIHSNQRQWRWWTLISTEILFANAQQQEGKLFHSVKWQWRTTTLYTIFHQAPHSASHLITVFIHLPRIIFPLVLRIWQSVCTVSGRYDFDYTWGARKLIEKRRERERKNGNERWK